MDLFEAKIEIAEEDVSVSVTLDSEFIGLTCHGFCASTYLLFSYASIQEVRAVARALLEACDLAESSTRKQ